LKDVFADARESPLSTKGYCSIVVLPHAQIHCLAALTLCVEDTAFQEPPRYAGALPPPVHIEPHEFDRRRTRHAFRGLTYQQLCIGGKCAIDLNDVECRFGFVQYCAQLLYRKRG